MLVNALFHVARLGPSGPLFHLALLLRSFHHLAEKEGIISGDETGDLNLAQRHHLGLRIFYMLNLLTWLYFPSEGRRTKDFFALKKSTASIGFEPAILGMTVRYANRYANRYTYNPICKFSYLL